MYVVFVVYKHKIKYLMNGWEKHFAIDANDDEMYRVVTYHRVYRLSVCEMLAAIKRVILF